MPIMFVYFGSAMEMLIECLAFRLQLVAVAALYWEVLTNIISNIIRKTKQSESSLNITVSNLKIENQIAYIEDLKCLYKVL